MKYKTISSILFLIFIFTVLLMAIISPTEIIYPEKMYDEGIYKEISDGLHSQGLDYLKTHYDTKPLSFHLIQYFFDGNILYTRILNIILIGITTYFIFKLTGSRLAILYPMIPMFLNGMILNTEIIKAMFVVMSLYYIRYSGVFIGLASIFNPFSALCIVLLNKRNILYSLLVGGSFVSLLLYTGIFFPYIDVLISYEKMVMNVNIYWHTVIFLIVFFIIGSRDLTIRKYAMILAFPIITRPYYNHYYIAVYTLLFIGYLLETEGGIKWQKELKNMKV